MIKYTLENIISRVKSGWLEFFKDEEVELRKILDEINKYDEIIYPKEKDLLRALFYYDPTEIKLLLLGQDPYINQENDLPQAMGLSFSVPKKHKKIPPSLKNIFKEIKNNYSDFNIPTHGLLKRWAKKEKILLLNSALTVCAGKSNTHAQIWKEFTDKLIKWFQNKNKGCIFLLMGSFAHKKEELIDQKKHKIFKTIHPSPLSAYNGFFGCNVFKQINSYLEENKKEIINW
jgi:uracil-DNA glycosylase